MIAFNPRNIFLFDGLGALITALFLSVVMRTFQSYFGMPDGILIVLAAIAWTLSIYSISCYLLLRRNLKIFLKMLSAANLFYCCLTGGMVLCYWHLLTAPAVVYFTLEILVIVSLALIEIRFQYHPVLMKRDKQIQE